MAFDLSYSESDGVRYAMATMMIIEVRGQMISWPEDFAAIMIAYYQKHGVPFLVHGVRHERNPKEKRNPPA